MTANKSENRFTKIAIVGAGGHLGSHIVTELLKNGHHDITAISRQGSDSKFPEGLRITTVDYSSEETIVDALRGHHFLIITLRPSTTPEVHPTICNAAVKAGVQWIMPNAYGMDPYNDRLINENVYGPVVRKAIADVKVAGGHYVILTCGFWYEWSLVAGPDFYGFDVKDKKAVFFDDGTTKIVTSTLAQCGRAVAALLDLPVIKESEGPALEDWKDGALYISSFTISQREMLDAIHHAMGDSDSDWVITSERAHERTKKALEALQEGKFSGFAQAMYTRFFYGNGDGNYGAMRGLDNGKLGLPQEDIDDVTKWAVDKQLKDGYLYDGQYNTSASAKKHLSA